MQYFDTDTMSNIPSAPKLPNTTNAGGLLSRVPPPSALPSFITTPAPQQASENLIKVFHSYSIQLIYISTNTKIKIDYRKNLHLKMFNKTMKLQHILHLFLRASLRTSFLLRSSNL